MLFEKIDLNGNRLLLETFDAKQRQKWKIKLQLKSEKRERLLGHYDSILKVLYLKRDSMKHYHYKTKAYGINAGLIDSLEINDIHFVIDKKHYLIPIDEMKNCIYLNFKSDGFELQKFLPTEIIYKYAL